MDLFDFELFKSIGLDVYVASDTESTLIVQTVWVSDVRKVVDVLKCPHLSVFVSDVVQFPTFDFRRLS